MKMKWIKREIKCQTQLVRSVSNHHQPMLNRREMKIRSQQVKHIFLVFFGIKINAKLKWTKYGQTSNSIQINFNKSN